MAEANQATAVEQTRLAKQILGKNHWQKLLSDVDKLSEDLFDSNKSDRFHCYHHFQVFVTDDHAKAVENTLYDLIFGDSEESIRATAKQSADVFVPTDEECMFLCAATRLRCIGLLWGLFIDEERTKPINSAETPSYHNTQVKPPNWLHSNGRVDSQVIERLIETFPSRSSCYVREDWELECSWKEREKAILCSILNSYLPTVSERDIPEKIDDVRVRKLAYLLRVATACTLGKDVCPLEIRLHLQPNSLCDMRKTHLAPVNWVTKTKFDHSRNVVEFRALVPAIERIPDPKNGSRLPVAYVDFASGLDYLGVILQNVIDTVSDYLEGCKNTRIRTVRIESQHSAPDTFRTAESFLPDHWALPLAAAVNAAEVAGMTALVLRSFCKFGFGKPTISFRDQVSQVCDAVAHANPCNALTRKLIRQVRTSFRWDSEPDRQKREDFQQFLTSYLTELADAGNRVSEQAVRQNVLWDSAGKELDYIAVYGYSRLVLSTLITSGFRGIVLLIDID